MEGRNSAHPLLRGGRPPCPHGFSFAEMESLAALCDTFIPSKNNCNDFESISGSQYGMPAYMAGLIAKHFPRAAVIMVRCVLLCLYTRLGTLLLCGTQSLSKALPFPYLQNFAAIPRHVREKILLQWSLGTASIFDPLFQLIFKTFKTCCLYFFYSRADESGWNPSWKAIGYSPPYIARPKPETRALDGGIIDASSATDADLQRFLGDAGFEISREIGMNGEQNLWKVKCDCVVVGSGAGGGVAAGKLAGAGFHVLVVEKGKYFAAGDLSMIEGPSMDEMYARGGLLASRDAKVSVLAGATVGGGSAINWCACIRTPPHVLREWANEEGLSLFQSHEYELAMSEVWERDGVNNGWEKESFQNKVLRKGCGALGYEVTDVCMNATPGHFCGSCSFGCRSGEKKGTPETWLLDAVAANARILAGCEALEVTWTRNRGFKEKTATGVLCRAGGNRFLVEAKATVAACGALMTPSLLLASGLKNPHIGANLHVHPVRMAWGYFPPEVEPQGRCYQGCIITAMCKEGSEWEGSGYGTVIQTPALAPGCFASLMPWISGADMKERMKKYQRTAHLFTLIRDRGSGRVEQSLEVDYKVTASCDKKNLEKSLERALRILIAAGATEVGTHHSDGRVFKVEKANESEIERYVKEVRENEGWCPVVSAHQMGSCRMGVDPTTSCVDDRGETWEMEGLFVSDGSVLPTALGVNPMITIQSVALCISHRVAQFLQQ